MENRDVLGVVLESIVLSPCGAIEYRIPPFTSPDGSALISSMVTNSSTSEEGPSFFRLVPESASPVQSRFDYSHPCTRLVSP